MPYQLFLCKCFNSITCYSDQKLPRDSRIEIFNFSITKNVDIECYYYHFIFRWKGENVSTQEVASLICDLDIIADCCVYGVKTPSEDGRCGMAAIVLKPGVTHDKGTDSYISYGILCYILEYTIIQIFDT